MHSLGSATRYFPFHPSPFLFTGLFHSWLYTKLTELSNQLSFSKIYIEAALRHSLFCQALRGTNKQLYIPAFLMVSRARGGRLKSHNNRLLGCCHPLLYIQCHRNSRVIPNSICWSQTTCPRPESFCLGTGLQINDLWSRKRAMMLTIFSLCFLFVPLLTQYQQPSFSPTCHFDRSHGLICDECPAGYVGPRCER